MEFIKTHHLSGPMLNEWVDGGYLLWAAPEHPVFIDGRGDIYEWAGVLAEFQNWALLQTDPNVLLEKYRISFCLLARHSPMVTVMSLLKNWQIAYQDDQYGDLHPHIAGKSRDKQESQRNLKRGHTQKRNHHKAPSVYRYRG